MNNKLEVAIDGCINSVEGVFPYDVIIKSITPTTLIVERTDGGVANINDVDQDALAQRIMEAEALTREELTAISSRINNKTNKLLENFEHKGVMLPLSTSNYRDMWLFFFINVIGDLQEYPTGMPNSEGGVFPIPNKEEALEVMASLSKRFKVVIGGGLGLIGQLKMMSNRNDALDLEDNRT